MSPAETAKILAILAAAYPGFEVDETRHRLWHEMLGHLEYAVAQAAIRKHIAESKWPPTVAEVLEAAREVVFGPALLATDVWPQVLAAIRRYGNYGESRAREQLPAAVLEVIDALGGWQHVCMSENLDMLRAHFLRAWDSIVAREKRIELTQLATGDARPLHASRRASLPNGEHACEGGDR